MPGHPESRKVGCRETPMSPMVRAACRAAVPGPEQEAHLSRHDPVSFFARYAALHPPTNQTEFPVVSETRNLFETSTRPTFQLFPLVPRFLRKLNSPPSLEPAVLPCRRTYIGGPMSRVRPRATRLPNRADLLCGRGDDSHGHDLHEDPRRRQLGLDGRPRGRVGLVDPAVVGLVHGGKVGDVLEEDLHLQDVRLVGAVGAEDLGFRAGRSARRGVEGLGG
ncbi:hypothetical protein DFJ74DRAFT_393216 [Hyaloraphidium curvatum]|nr:hypothetical protein DFJ74DRAFT_393216 [Hyaloraphidium curvatum]